jgi:ATP-dependent Zn protease
MFNKASLITSLLFFLLGTNVFAQSYLKDSSPKKDSVLTTSIITYSTKQTTAAATSDKTTSLRMVTTANSNSITKVAATNSSEKKAENTELSTNKIEATEPTFKDYVVPGSVGLVIIILFGSYWLIFRRKYS